MTTPGQDDDLIPPPTAESPHPDADAHQPAAVTEGLDPDQQGANHHEGDQ